MKWIVGVAIGVLADIQLLLVHGPGGQEIRINVAEITSIRQVREKGDSHFAPDVHCLIFVDSGRFVAVTESCLQIVDMIAQMGAPAPHHLN
jgi:hypothetical protein